MPPVLMVRLAIVVVTVPGSLLVVVAFGITTESIPCGTTLAQPLQLEAVVQVEEPPVHVQVCAFVSMTRFLFAPSELVAPGVASVRLALLRPASRIVAPFRASALVDE